MITNRAHLAIGADKVFEVTDCVGETNVLERKHVINHPEIFERFQLELIDVPRLFLMHQWQGELRSWWKPLANLARFIFVSYLPLIPQISRC